MRGSKKEKKARILITKKKYINAKSKQESRRDSKKFENEFETNSEFCQIFLVIT